MAYLIALLATLFIFGDSAPAPSGGLDGSGEVTIALDPLTEPREDLPLPRVTPARGEDPPLVVIDAGHGGRDPGAASPFGERLEKHVTLAIARAIRNDLAQSGRVRVALTREDDRYLLLQDRYEIARRLGADLFISIHADAAPSNDGARGATIYTLSEVASDRHAALLAQRENSADLVGGARLSQDPTVNVILIDLAQRESMDVSADFARILYREASSVFPFRPEWHRFASLVVLKAPDIPSVLFESGYLTNEVDVAYIHSPEGQRQIADGMRRAVEAHFARRFLAARRPEA
ncbi:N-acetylmuramoyl-L-alanine amidase family protein [Allosphingosinicella sp.]|jgi:N-acetylmuramoyl-L-alanine amidase|uniref:N-acetylmuramoyl-L-alanine amidase family protein n=1 Tax=Allosphingosinicella sp. TaxID=2823234 RepID=UPI002EEAB59F